MWLAKILIFIVGMTNFVYAVQHETYEYKQKGSASVSLLQKTPEIVKHPHSILYRWVQIGKDNSIIVRAIVPSNVRCEDIKNVAADGSEIKMKQRAVANGSTFNVNSCEAVFFEPVKTITFDEQPVKVLPKRVQRIAIIGDTGCRINSSATDIQNCNNKDDWPFEKIANHIAEHEKPDVVVHVGDYHYREGECPAGDHRCAGSPYGYNWPVWQADFFEPAKKLLANYPWVFVRGNHEVCPTASNEYKGRAWRGWMRFLSPYPYHDNMCDTETYYTVTLPLTHSTLSLAVIDTSPLQSKYQRGEEEYWTRYYARTFQVIDEQTNNNTWLFFHHPLWYEFIRNGESTAGNKLLHNSLKRIYGDKYPSHIENDYIRMVITGHTHLVGLFNFSVDSEFIRQSQMIVGNSGTGLYENGLGMEVDGIAIDPHNSFLRKQFGYTIAERDDDDGAWRFIFKDVDGRKIAYCLLIDDTEFQRCRLFD